MKRLLTLLITFHCLVTFGQYKLDVGIGYNHPAFDLVANNNYYGVYNYSKGQFSGIQGHIALQRQFSYLFSHSIGIGYMNLWTNNETVHYFPYSPENVITYKESHSYGFYQLFYMASLYPFRKPGLVLHSGLTIDRLQYEKKEIDDERSFMSNYHLGGENLALMLGAGYELNVSDRYSIYLRRVISKSLIHWYHYAEFDPYFGYIGGNFNYRFKLGMLYDLKDDVKTPKEIKEYKKTDPMNSTLFRSLELNAFYVNGSRSFVTNGDLKGSSGGYSEYRESYSPKNMLSYNGAGIGANLNINQSYNLIEFAWEHYNTNAYYNYTVNKFDPHDGSYTNYTTYEDFRSFSDDRIRISIGTGIQIRRFSKRFNIIPVVKLSNSISVNLKDKSNYNHRHHYYYSVYSPSGAVEWDSTSYPSRIKVNQSDMNLMLGCILKLELFSDFMLKADLGYRLLSSQIVDLPTGTIIDRQRFRNSIGISYKIPLKEKSKPDYSDSGGT